MADRSMYELSLAGEKSRPSRPGKEMRFSSLPGPLLAENVLWSCRLRWVAITILAVFGFLGLVPGLVGRIGMRAWSVWPFVIAAILVLGNLAFLEHARIKRRRPSEHSQQHNLWAQIVFDLLVLTAVVHFAGSRQTYAPFVYLFHIILACVFFSRFRSFLVALLACALYSLCIAAEEMGFVSSASIFIETPYAAGPEIVTWAHLANLISALAVWLVIWYLTSHLSTMVHVRDYELAETNRRLIEAQEEKARHMLRTTHELKAPFAGIHANAQLLLKGYCGELPPDAHDVVVRISERARRLASEIQQMLQLVNLTSTPQDALTWVELDVAEVLRWCLAQVASLAKTRHVVIEQDLQPAPAVAVEDHMKMLFSNLLANAVTYSSEGGVVRVRCHGAMQGGPVVTVEDQGIGIPPEKLPRIFEDYYRTDEAVRHNKESTGLGLAIVRQVAEVHRLRVHVESEPGVGTKFTVTFTDKRPVNVDTGPAPGPGPGVNGLT